MNDTLTFPADVPGLLRVGSVCWWLSKNGRRKRAHVIRVVERGPSWCGGKPSALVTLACHWPEEMSMIEAHPDHELQHVAWATCWLSLDELALDLTDATSRAHLTWLVSDGCWVNDEGFVDGSDLTSAARLNTIIVDFDGNMQRCLTVSSAHPGRGDVHYRESRVAMPADLNPGDSAQLPDGSRVVDARALRLVGLYVAGRTP